jgi:urease gamma subunit
MPQCKKCNKKGLFLKIEEDTGLCLSCNEAFAREGKTLTEKITEAKNAVSATEDAEQIVKLCKAIEDYGEKLMALHETYNLQPSQELVDLVRTYRKMGERARK